MLQKSFEENPGTFIEIDGAVKTIEMLNESDKWEVGIATGSWKEAAMLKLKFLILDKLDLLLEHPNCLVPKMRLLSHLLIRLRKKMLLSLLKK